MDENPALVIAAHGTRDPNGVTAARALESRVSAMLPGVRVRMGFVELTEPSIDRALAEVLAEQNSPRAVVVPLMIGTGTHVREDIPSDIAKGTPEGVRVNYAPHLGPDPKLISRLADQIRMAGDQWKPQETTVVLVGRGSLVSDANADHCRLARLVMEQAGYAEVMPAFIQVAFPDLPTGLARAVAGGAKRIIVAPHFLFPGRLLTWTHEQSAAFASRNPQVEIRVADVLGDCDELAQVVVERYLASLPDGAPVYLSGLLLEGRQVLMVGGGKVAARRLDALVATGARVHVVSPEVGPVLAQAVANGQITWTARGFVDSDCDGAWYVLALTDAPDVNAAVVKAALARHTFVVRADDAAGGTAYTPATARSGGLTVGVVGDRNPVRSARVRDGLLQVLTRS